MESKYKLVFDFGWTGRKSGKCFVLFIDEVVDGNNRIGEKIRESWLLDRFPNSVRGDLLVVNKYNEKIVYIRDCQDFVRLEMDKQNNFIIPDNFYILINDIPSNYWINDETNQIPIMNIVWFPISLVRNEILTNIKLFDWFKPVLYTTFKWKNVVIKIVYETDKNLSDKHIQASELYKFQKILYKNDILSFELYSGHTKPLKTCPIYTKNNTLILKDGG